MSKITAIANQKGVESDNCSKNYNGVHCKDCLHRICNHKCGLDEQPRRNFDDDDFCSQGEWRVK